MENAESIGSNFYPGVQDSKMREVWYQVYHTLMTKCFKGTEWTTTEISLCQGLIKWMEENEENNTKP